MTLKELLGYIPLTDSIRLLHGVDVIAEFSAIDDGIIAQYGNTVVEMIHNNAGVIEITVSNYTAE